jgi:outer membrane protein assembly factor BamD
LKKDLINDPSAGKEMEIGRFYQRSGKWLAAADPLPCRDRQISDQQPHARSIGSGSSRPISTSACPAKRPRPPLCLARITPGSKWYDRSYKLIQRNVPRG